MLKADRHDPEHCPHENVAYFDALHQGTGANRALDHQHEKLGEETNVNAGEDASPNISQGTAHEKV